MCNDCAICYHGDGGCLAGMRDDDFVPAEKEQLIQRLDNGNFPSYRQQMKTALLTDHLYDYDNRRDVVVTA